MGASGLLVNVLGSVAVGLLLIALGWAAIERGRVHHELGTAACSQPRRGPRWSLACASACWPASSGSATARGEFTRR